MFIRELHLTHFGRFHHKKIVFSPTMNVIYGKNEAGKSTIYHFIIGMFYGFFKPNVKKRLYLDLHGMYQPWNGGEYIGSLIFYAPELGVDLRIVRNFNSGQESVAVFREDTQEEITHTYDIHGVTRLPDIAKRHLELSYITFTNTFGLAQLGAQTHADLEFEIKDYVLSALSATNSTQSMQRIFDDIQKKIDDIGSMRRKSSVYFITKERLTVLSQELEEAKEHHRVLFEIKRSIDDYERQEIDVESRLKRVETMEQKKQLQDFELQQTELGQKLERLDHLSDLIAKQTQTKNELRYQEEFTTQELEEGHSNYRLLTEFKAKLHNINEVDQKKCETKSTIESIEQKRNELITKREDLEAKEKSTLHSYIVAENQRKKSRLFLVGSSFSLIVTLLVVGILYFLGLNQSGLINANMSLNLMILIMIILSTQGIGITIGTLVHRRASSMDRQLKEQHESINQMLLQTIAELGYYDAVEAKDSQTQMLQIEEELLKKLQDVRYYEQQISILETKLLPIISYYFIESEEDFTLLLRKDVLYHRCMEELSQLTIRYNDLVMGESPESLQLRLESLDSKIAHLNCRMTQENQKEEALLSHVSDCEDKTFIEVIRFLEDKETLEGALEAIRNTKNNLYGKLDSLSLLKRSLAAIEEEIVQTNDELAQMEESLRVHQKVFSTLEQITQELAHNFAPYLNRSLSELVEEVTKDKYRDIKVNPQLQIRFSNETGDHIISPDKISQGTKDLLYIALRRALSLWISEDKELPLIYDEPFAHFDDERLALALDFLGKNKGQTIVFSCQKREVLWIESQGNRKENRIENFNLVKL